MWFVTVYVKPHCERAKDSVLFVQYKRPGVKNLAASDGRKYIANNVIVHAGFSDVPFDPEPFFYQLRCHGEIRNPEQILTLDSSRHTVQQQAEPLSM